MAFLKPSEIIANLDRALGVESGTSAVLKRRVEASTTFVSLNIRVRLSGYNMTELVGPVTQEDRHLVMSPSQITAAGAAWPGAAGGSQWPRKGDLIVQGGKEYRVEASDSISVMDTVVTIKGRVRG